MKGRSGVGRGYDRRGGGRRQGQGIPFANGPRNRSRRSKLRSDFKPSTRKFPLDYLKNQSARNVHLPTHEDLLVCRVTVLTPGEISSRTGKSWRSGYLAGKYAALWKILSDYPEEWHEAIGSCALLNQSAEWPTVAALSPLGLIVVRPYAALLHASPCLWYGTSLNLRQLSGHDRRLCSGCRFGSQA